MKKADTHINFKNDEVTMLGQKLKLKFIRTGHYAITLMGHYSELDSQKAVMTVFLKLEEMDREMKKKACKKLHIQFGHPDTDRLHDLLKDAKVVDKEVFDLVADVEKACYTCNKFKKLKIRPVVGFALARDFNDFLAMALKPYNNVHFLHMIDHATRFSSACVIPNKRHDVVIESVFKHWIALFGAPKKILSDNGSEFNDKVFRELGELLNIELKTTGAESPWSNGITEWHNRIIGNMVDKILHDQNCSVELALAWLSVQRIL